MAEGENSSFHDDDMAASLDDIDDVGSKLGVASMTSVASVEMMVLVDVVTSSRLVDNTVVHASPRVDDSVSTTISDGSSAHNQPRARQNS